MFKDNKRSIQAETLIGQGTSMEGTMISEASIRIEGEYRGDIECKANVIIGECGVARSNISAKEIVVAGKVIGDVATSGRLTITSSGSVQGSIQACGLHIQDGGMFSGACHMEQQQRQAAAKSAPPDDKGQKAKDSSKDKTRQAG
ncbi:bactofilin family protein [Paenibacillus nasutitermitis]|uniref:Polymer-forming cytoskeletal protein n=1 Tax=Paenibacillus nasutitermitis TaxID=1652958 RepID=A0A916Z4F0_9BACL|nr:polymer-forming cytoskeletal protein [Paenibacillus nasutitermitis]GGD75934.1 hypothetical protein GCM10010911_37430 [Paenibacillus nasutitermitis]